MGSEQSKSTAASRTVIEERLRALQLEKKQSVNEDGFVEVESGFLNEKTLEALRHSPSTLDVDELEGWQGRLLQDPKNRLVGLLPLIDSIPVEIVLTNRQQTRPLRAVGRQSP